MNKNVDKNNNIKLNNKTSIIQLIPIVFIIAIVPLLVRGKVINLDGLRYVFWTGQHIQFDVFTYWKAAALIVSFALMLLIYIFNLKKKNIVFNLEKHYAIPLAVMAATFILSTLFAIDKTTAVYGFPDMLQGIFVLGAYIFTVMYVGTVVGTEKSVKIILKSFAILIIIEGILGVGQYFGHDFFKTSIGQNLIVPNSITLDGGLNFTFGAKTIYATMFNTNFVGSFAVLAIPVMFSMIICSKKWLDRVTYAVALVAAIFVGFGSNSRAGYLGLMVAFIVAIILMRKQLLKKWKYSVIILALGMLCLFTLNKVSDGKLINRIKTLNVFSEEVTSRFGYKDAFYLESVETEGTSLTIKSNKETIKVVYSQVDNEAKMRVCDADGNTLDMTKSTDDYYNIMIDGNKSNFLIKPVSDYLGFDLKTVEGSVLNFMMTDEVNLLTSTGALLSVKNYEYNEFLNERGRMASGRGYIWSRSLPLMKEYLIYGAGPDNYSYAFPQGDIVGKINLWGAGNDIVVDKPHNMYIQMAINTGVLSVLAFLALIAMYAVSVVKTIWKSKFTYYIDKIDAAILISIMGYLAAGMFNDQINSVAPIFYVLLGLGIAVNRICQVENRRQEYMNKKHNSILSSNDK